MLDSEVVFRYSCDMKKEVLQIAELIKSKGGKAYLVGGCVRAFFTGEAPKDFDFEVYGLSPLQLTDSLRLIGKVDMVGESFSVFKLYMGGEIYDLALPRTERKIGDKHTDFEVTADAFLAEKDACARRDFTMNAILYDPLTGEFVDFYGGITDIKEGVIRHVKDESFVEDALRVLRAAQFSARFNFEIAEETVNLCKTIDLGHLSVERIREEFYKLLSAPFPAKGLSFLYNSGKLKEFFDINFISAREFDRVQEFADSASDLSKEQRICGALVALHSFFFVADLRSMLDKLDIWTLNGYNIREQAFLLTYVEFRYVKDLDRKFFLHGVDKGLDFQVFGKLFQAYDFVMEKLVEYDLPVRGKIKPLLSGEDLLGLGFVQGKELGTVFKTIFQAQLDDKIRTKEEALDLLRSLEKNVYIT